MDEEGIVLTAEGRQELLDELALLEGEKRQEIIEHIKEARSFGDLSENAEYDAAKEEQSKNEARIAEIRNILAHARDAEVGEALIVSLDSTVTLVDADGVTQEFKIVGTTQTNSLEHKISNESPVGKAVIGHAEGDTVEVVTPSGKVRIYTIAKVKH